MTVLTRGTRTRRGGRRPGWLLLTVLLVLAITASSALVFTNRVELLKLAVILALWAAVAAAFVSVIYRRQSDLDQAKARDLKLVYDLQLDREISARREYELTVETQLRRELVSELRAQAADEVAALRAELAALRTNLEILFDTDLGNRPAIETDRTTVRAYSDWARDNETTGRVSSSRIDADVAEDDDEDIRTEESPIIDVSAEPQPPENHWAQPVGYGGAHRRPSEAEPAPDEPRGRRHRVTEAERRPMAEEADRRPMAEERQPVADEPQPVADETQPADETQSAAEAPSSARQPPQEPPEPAQPEQPPVRGYAVPSADWQPAPAEGQWIPAGVPGSNWVSPVAENGSAAEYVGRRRATEAAVLNSPAQPAQPAMSIPAADLVRGRHSALADAVDPSRPAAPILATESAQPPPHPEPEPEPAEESADERLRGAEDTEEDDGQHTDGLSVAELLVRLQATPSGGGRRRRREE
jgi:hypothetical protein